MNEEQIAELKALVDELQSQGLSTADIQTKVDERKATFVEGKRERQTVLRTRVQL
jgi:hypothetical protein